MGAKNDPDAENTPFLITTVTQSREPFFVKPAAARMLIGEIDYARRELGFALLAFVVMPDHLHMLLVPSSNLALSVIVQTIKGRFARRWNLARHARGKVWQASYFESGVRTQAQLGRWISYIDLNPVEAGIAQDAALYPYSSAGGALPVDIDAYFDGPWPDQAEAWPSEMVAP
jgi:putative transposase